MPLLQVRDFPKEIYEKLAERAQLEHRSVAQETIVLLKKQLLTTDDSTSKRKRVLSQLKQRPIRISETALNPVDLIREDRDR